MVNPSGLALVARESTSETTDESNDDCAATSRLVTQCSAAPDVGSLRITESTARVLLRGELLLSRAS